MAVRRNYNVVFDYLFIYQSLFPEKLDPIQCTKYSVQVNELTSVFAFFLLRCMLMFLVAVFISCFEERAISFLMEFAMTFITTVSECFANINMFILQYRIKRMLVAFTALKEWSMSHCCMRDLNSQTLN